MLRLRLILVLCLILFGLTLLGMLRESAPRNPPATIENPKLSEDVTSSDNGRSKETTKRGAKLKGSFTIGPATTYVSGPLDADGCVDYASALHERRSKGITPSKNAHALIWMAIGRSRFNTLQIPSRYFELLGISKTSMDEAPIYTTLIEHLEMEHVAEDQKQRITAFRTGLKPRTWSAKEYPHLGSWLLRNEKSLALIAEASRRDQDYCPLVSFKSDLQPSELWSARSPIVAPYLELLSAFAVRAMLKIDEGKADAAWSDLLSAHYLAVRLASSGTVNAGTTGLDAAPGILATELLFLEHAKPSAQLLEMCIRELKALPRTPDLIEIVGTNERLKALDFVMQLTKKGSDFLKTDDGKNAGLPVFDGVDYDPVFEKLNSWYDKLVAAINEKDRIKRNRRLSEIESELLTTQSRVRDGKGVLPPPPGMSPEKAAGHILGDLVAPLAMPKIRELVESSDVAVQSIDIAIVAFALAWFHRDNGRYPDKLDALAPKYLKEVPRDLFSGNILIYRPMQDGYLLYSVGPNGKDDGGRGPEDQSAGDDLVVRVPVPR